MKPIIIKKDSEYAKRIWYMKVIHKGIKTFGSISKFDSWLHSEIIALGDRKPIDVILEGNGEQVYDILGRIEHGVFS
jgi:uncharacterized protein (DUF2384 family)